MGCNFSVYQIYSKNESINKLRQQFECLQFSGYHVGKLYQLYKKIDFDDSGSIEFHEMAAYLNIDTSNYARRVFTMFDEDNSGKIDFREFVMSLWSYCTLSRSTLAIFSFDLYDLDSSGSIGADEVTNMLKELYGDKYHTNPHARNIAKELEEIEAVDGDVNMEDFAKFSHTHQALLFPAFQLQETLRKSILGVEFWLNLTGRRLEISQGKFVSVNEFMNMHLGNKFDETKVVFNLQTVDLIKSTGSLGRRQSSFSPAKIPQIPNQTSSRKLSRKLSRKQSINFSDQNVKQKPLPKVHATPS